VLLAAPIGSESSMEKMLLVKFSELRQISDRMKFLDMHDPLIFYQKLYVYS
jgi:hypothetical protein